MADSMKIIYRNNTHINVGGKKCEVYEFVLSIVDHKSYAENMIHEVCDNSWIAKLDTISKTAYEQAAQRTVEKLTEIFERQSFDSQLRDEFGEYMISISSVACLVEQLAHQKLPIAELWKEKVTGNPGFDFHTLSPQVLLAFGEAKYRSRSNAYGEAAKQVVEFIDLGKDFIELADLRNFSEEAAEKLANDKIRSFTLAFSINSGDYDSIFENAIKNENVKKIAICAQELYLIGVTHA